MAKAKANKPTRRPRTSARRIHGRTQGAAIPLLEFDGGRIAIIEPARVIKPIDIAEHCVLCFFQEVIREVVHEAHPVHTGQSEAGDYPVYELDYGGRRLAVVSPGMGAPAAVSRLERMIALGCRKFIACGGAGTLDGGLEVGRIVVPDAAVRDEGASHYYLRPAREVAPTARALAAIEAVLRENNHEYIRGKTWTTDAVYRETRARVQRRRREGCVVVEMRRRHFSRSRVFAGSSARRFYTPATAWRAANGPRADGTATRCASGCSISPRRLVCGCSLGVCRPMR